MGNVIRRCGRLILCCYRAFLTFNWVAVAFMIAFAKEEAEDHEIVLPLGLDGYLRSGWGGALEDRMRPRLAEKFTRWEVDDAWFGEELERVIEALMTSRSGANPRTVGHSQEVAHEHDR